MELVATGAGSVASVSPWRIRSARVVVRLDRIFSTPVAIKIRRFARNLYAHVVDNCVDLLDTNSLRGVASTAMTFVDSKTNRKAKLHVVRRKGDILYAPG